jgi:hypothetical protein
MQWFVQIAVKIQKDMTGYADIVYNRRKLLQRRQLQRPRKSRGRQQLSVAVGTA